MPTHLSSFSQVLNSFRQATLIALEDDVGEPRKHMGGRQSPHACSRQLSGSQLLYPLGLMGIAPVENLQSPQHQHVRFLDCGESLGPCSLQIYTFVGVLHRVLSDARIWIR